MRKIFYKNRVVLLSVNFLLQIGQRGDESVDMKKNMASSKEAKP